MHSLDACDDDSSSPKRLEYEYRSCDSLDLPAVLLDDVIDVLVLAHQDVDTGVSLDAFKGGRVGAALVDWRVSLPPGAIRGYSGKA